MDAVVHTPAPNTMSAPAASIVGKALPDAPYSVVSTPTTKSTVSKLMVKGKTMVLCFVDDSSPTESKAAVQLMEDNAFKHTDKTVFVIVSCDSQKSAETRHADSVIKKCQHILIPAATAQKSWGIVRRPHHIVVGADGKVKYSSEEEANQQAAPNNAATPSRIHFLRLFEQLSHKHTATAMRTIISLLLLLFSSSTLLSTTHAQDSDEEPDAPDVAHIVPLCVSLQIHPDEKLTCKEAGKQQPKVVGGRPLYTCESNTGATFLLSHDPTRAAWIVSEDTGTQKVVAGIHSWAVTPELIRRVSPRARPLFENAQEKGFTVTHCPEQISALGATKSVRNARTFFLDITRTKENEALPLFLGSFYSLVAVMNNPTQPKDVGKYCKGFGNDGSQIPVYFGHSSQMYLWCLDFRSEGTTEVVPRWYFSNSAADVGTEQCSAFCQGNWILDSEYPSGCQFVLDDGSGTWTEFANVRTTWSTFLDDDDPFIRVIRWRTDDWVERAHPNTKSLKLTNEMEIPLLGFGTGGLDDKQTKTSLAAAFKAGYVLVDTASEYGTEAAVGDAVVANLPNGARGAIIMTKVWPVDLGFERTTNAVYNSRAELKVSFIDSVLLHWPKCYAEWNEEWMDCTDASPDTDPANPLWRESWKALEKLYAEGVVLSIGVSNFDRDLLEEAVQKADGIAPQIVQNQFSLKNLDEDAVEFARQHGMVYIGYALLRDGIDANERTALKKMIRERFANEPQAKQEELIKNERYVLMRWAIENNVGIIPRSKNAMHVKKNIEVTLAMEWTPSSNPEVEDILDYPVYEHSEEL